MKNNWEEIFTSKIKDILHEKRKTTETHIKQLQQEGKQSVRYTAMMPDIPFLVFGLLSDIGWIIHLAAGITYFCRNGFHYVLGRVDTKPNNASFRQNFTHPALKSLDRRQPACDFLPCLRKIYARKSAYYLSVNTP